jgi:uroporphyrin-3 C-methyltransferase
MSKQKAIKASSKAADDNENWLSDDQAQAVKTEGLSGDKVEAMASESSSLAKASFLFVILAWLGLGVVYMEFQNQQRALQKNSEALRQQLAEVNQLQAQQKVQLAELVEYNPTNWVVSEVLYMLRIADRKLWLEQDQATALSLLQESNVLLSTLKDPELVKPMQMLMQDLYRVKQVQQTDVKSSVSRMNQLISSVETLPLVLLQQEPRQDNYVSTSALQSVAPEPSQDWQTHWKQSWVSLFDDIVTIRHHEGGVPALMSPDQVWYLKENLRQQLLAAQVALYRMDAQNYRVAVDNLLLWTRRYVDLQAPKGQAMLSALLKLEMVQFSKTAHQTFASIAALESVLRQKTRLSKGGKL